MLSMLEYNPKYYPQWTQWSLEGRKMHCLKMEVECNLSCAK